MKILFALAIASSYGLLLRVFFGYISSSLEIMSLAFLVLVPGLIGYLTVRFWPADSIQSKLRAFTVPWLTSLIILIITIALAIEGVICWVMIYPFFSTAAGIGGVIAFQQIKKKPKVHHNPDLLDDEDWNNSGTLKMSLLLLLPLVVGMLEGDRTTSRRDMHLERSITIAAPAETVWRTITQLGQVDHAEKGTPLTNLIGFPKHLYTTLDRCALGGKRVAHYEGGLFFEETITELIPNEKLVLDIHVDPDKVPPTVLDEHIVIGGKYVDVLEDTYRLTANTDGTTHVTLASRYYINTPFNWYAGWWAELLLSELLNGELRMIEQRAKGAGN